MSASRPPEGHKGPRFWWIEEGSGTDDWERWASEREGWLDVRLFHMESCRTWEWVEGQWREYERPESDQ